MNTHYYRLPLNLGQVVTGSASEKCGLGESISQNLFLLICTRKGEMPGAPDFGCDIWDLQFERIVDRRRWQDAIEGSLKKGIIKFEPRIISSKIGIELNEVEVSYPFRQYPEVKHQAQIRIDAHLKHSGEPFYFATEIYISPLAG